uniref:Uncharacterized protein n=1 Tax=Osugoroshi virus TaxID=2202814 RepID=A0A7R7T1P7_9VIRU|nr:hypothetical protein [Osugoroshi virus]
MSTFPSNQARLMDPDAHCIKFISTYSYDVCFEKLETVMNEMALGRMSANLLRIHSCMNIATHLRYRMLVLSENVNAEDRQFMTEYEYSYKFYLQQQSPSGNASHTPVPRKKTRRGKRLNKIRGVSDSTSISSDMSPSSNVETTILNCSSHHGLDSDSIHSGSHTITSPTTDAYEAESKSSIVVLPSLEVSEELREQPEEPISSIDENFESQDKILSCDYLDCKSYCSSCSCAPLNSPSMFHINCVDLSTLLERFEPFSYRNESGDHIEVHSPQKHLGQKRSQPETTSVDEIISMYSSACRPADPSLSTWNFVDWRELLSWASCTLSRC